MDRETDVQTYRSIEATYASHIRRNEQRRDIYKRYRAQKRQRDREIGVQE